MSQEGEVKAKVVVWKVQVSHLQTVCVTTATNHGRRGVAAGDARAQVPYNARRLYSNHISAVPSASRQRYQP